MGELVSAISCLCKLLNNIINTSLRPEIFRLSKLNKLNIEEIEQFWDFLHKLCCFSTSETCQSNAKKCVTSYLLTEAPVIAYALPPEATPRQLLLCLGWVLSHGVLENLIDKIIFDTPLGKELPITPEDPEVDLKLGENCSEKGLNFAVFLSGVIQHNLKAISNYRQERAHLLAKLHKATAGICGLSHLSAGEVNLLSQPALVVDFLKQCQHCIPILENYWKWHKKSPVFWQWMDSVLREEESLQVNKHLSDKEVHHLMEFSKALENNVRRKARLEDEDIAQEKLECLFVGKMELNEEGQLLEKAIGQLDSRIEILNKISVRKKEELQIKLSNKKYSNEVIDEINVVLNQFGFCLLQHTQPTQPAIEATQALTKLSLEQCKQT